MAGAELEFSEAVGGFDQEGAQLAAKTADIGDQESQKDAYFAVELGWWERESG